MKVEWCSPYPKTLPEGFNALYESGRFGQGELVEEFEAKLKEHFGSRRSFVCVNNGTSALFLAMHSQLNASNNVHIANNAFIANRNVAMALDIGIIPTDIDKYGCIQPWDDGECGIVIDFAGCSANYDELNGLDFIHDGCESIGTKIHGRCTWDLGKISCVSFQLCKQFTTLGEGGAVICNAKDVEQIKEWRNHGKFSNWGLNMRMTDLQALAGLYGLSQLDKAMKAREYVWKRYAEELPGLGIRPGTEHGYLWYVMPCKDGEAAEKALKDKGIVALQRYPYCFINMPVTNVISENVSLPTHSELSDEQIDYVIKCCKELL